MTPTDPALPGALPAAIRLRIDPWRAAASMACIVLGLGLAHVAAHLGRIHLDRAYLDGVLRFFKMGQEANLPTLLASLYLLGAGGLTLLIAADERRLHRRYASHWRVLGLLLMLLGVDEAAQLHEGVIGLAIGELYGRGEGVWHYSWYKLYIPLVLLFGAVYLRFLLALPARTSALMVCAGALYVAAAVGIEMVESHLVHAGLPGRAVTQLFEESGEMLGIVVLVYALLDYMGAGRLSLQVDLVALPSSTTRAPAPAAAARA